MLTFRRVTALLSLWSMTSPTNYGVVLHGPKDMRLVSSVSFLYTRYRYDITLVLKICNFSLNIKRDFSFYTSVIKLCDLKCKYLYTG